VVTSAYAVVTSSTKAAVKEMEPCSAYSAAGSASRRALYMRKPLLKSSIKKKQCVGAADDDQSYNDSLTCHQEKCFWDVQVLREKNVTG